MKGQVNIIVGAVGVVVAVAVCLILLMQFSGTIGSQNCATGTWINNATFRDDTTAVAGNPGTARGETAHKCCVSTNTTAAINSGWCNGTGTSNNVFTANMAGYTSLGLANILPLVIVAGGIIIALVGFA